MDLIKLIHNPDGTYVTKPFITKDEWLNVIRAAEKAGKVSQVDSLLRFFRMAANKGTCKAVAKEYGTDAESERSLITHFGVFAKKALGDKFRVESSDSEEETYWPIPMLGKDLGKKGFEWAVRPELVEALREYLLDDLMMTYRKRILEGGLDNKYSKELYKWQVLAACKGKSDIEVLRSMIDMNLISWRAAASLRKMLEAQPDETVRVFSIMKDPDRSFAEKVKDFKAETRKLAVKGIPNTIDNDRTAALLLACMDPVKNSLFKFDIYKVFCNYMGFSVVGGNGTFQHYLQLIQPIIEWENADAELTAKLHSETDSYFWSDLLNAQDVLWQMQFYMKESMHNNWLQKIYDHAILSKDKVFEVWFPKYRDSVNLFQAMFGEGNTAESISEETKKLFIRVSDNHISANRQGTYTDAEYSKILEVWPKVYETLKNSFLAGKIDKYAYEQLFKDIAPLLSKNRYAAYHRLWSGLFPECLTSIISHDRFYDVYGFISAQDDTLPPKTKNWLDDNYSLMAFFRDKVSFVEPWHRAVFGWYLYEYFTNKNSEIGSKMNMKEYTDLLEANMNLVLTGAPGTGKTYLARKIAKEMGDGNPGFVQFHPSYDYTDFVEGLRPDKGGGFVRRNGVFKDFCKRAVNSIDDALEAFKSAVSAAGTMSIPYVASSGTFSITAGPTSFPVTPKSPNGNPQSATYDDVYEVIRTGEQIGNKTYSFCIGTYIREHYLKRSFVFIIDEINRGELSKIFGELFFAIDPGHRGERVDTQYQNMIDDPNDPFKNGFYVPDNVYIIGTMNDIDRGVESMDFAIRRRFAWREVKSGERVSMLDEEIREWKDEAMKRMLSLNKALKDKKIGLTDAYDIGPAYFLKVKRYKGDFERLWEYHIKGVLAEYLRGTRDIEGKLIFLKEEYDKFDSEAEV